MTDKGRRTRWRVAGKSAIVLCALGLVTGVFTSAHAANVDGETTTWPDARPAMVDTTVDKGVLREYQEAFPDVRPDLLAQRRAPHLPR